MKRFLIICIILLCSSLYATNYESLYEKRDTTKSLVINLDKVTDDNDEFMFYLLSTTEWTKTVKIIYYIRCTDYDKIMKMLVHLQKNTNNSYQAIIQDYLESNSDLSLLYEKNEMGSVFLNESHCYILN